MELLLQIARGVDVYNKKVLKPESLVALAKRRCGIELDKESDIRVSFGQFRSPDSIIPQNYIEYAALDAEATYRVFLNQYREAELYAEPKSSLPVLLGARGRFGLGQRLRNGSAEACGSEGSDHTLKKVLARNLHGDYLPGRLPAPVGSLQFGTCGRWRCRPTA
jgi:hypothetical protein